MALDDNLEGFETKAVFRIEILGKELPGNETDIFIKIRTGGNQYAYLPWSLAAKAMMMRAAEESGESPETAIDILCKEAMTMKVNCKWERT